MEDVKNKRCPFRVCTVERPPMLRGTGTTVIQEFYNCMGEECAAYYAGGCMRLIPQAQVVNGEGVTYADMEKLRNYMRNAQSVAAPGADCHNCTIKGTAKACFDCALDLPREPEVQK